MSYLVTKALDRELNFKDFVLLCTRLINLDVAGRDDPLDAKIPNEIKIHPHYENYVKRDKKKILELKKVKNKEAWAKKYIAKQIKMYAQWRCEDVKIEDIQFLKDLLNKTEKWKVKKPVAEFKKLVTKQLKDAISQREEYLSYYETKEKELKEITNYQEYYEKQIREAMDSYNNSLQMFKKEKVQNKKRNTFLKALRTSLNAK